MNAVFQTNKVVRVILKSNGWRVFCKVIVHTDENWDMNRYDIHTPTFKSTAEIAGKPEWVDSIGEVYKDKKLSAKETKAVIFRAIRQVERELWKLA